MSNQERIHHLEIDLSEIRKENSLLRRLNMDATRHASEQAVLVDQANKKIEQLKDGHVPKIIAKALSSSNPGQFLLEHIKAMENVIQCYRESVEAFDAEFPKVRTVEGYSKIDKALESLDRITQQGDKI